MKDALDQQELPEPHAAFLRGALAHLPADPRLVGLAVGGSFLSRALDEYSDLDLVLVCEPASFAEVLQARMQIAGALGPLLAGFTGEHVGEPRLLICLYGPPLLHVDLKFVSLPDVAVRVEDPAILWEREGRLSAALQNGAAVFPSPDLQWIEDRFWVWVHYGATKIGRGELFEAHDFLAFLRGQVLGPLALLAAGGRPSGVRKLEVVAPEFALALQRTLTAYDQQAAAAALQAAVALYQQLRAQLADETLRLRGAAEGAALEYLNALQARLGALAQSR